MASIAVLAPLVAISSARMTSRDVRGAVAVPLGATVLGALLGALAHASDMSAAMPHVTALLGCLATLVRVRVSGS
jgi:hypothetical protein